MNSEPLIRVGLLTDGKPVTSHAGHGLTRISNLLIGKSFHWQQRKEILVEGEIMEEDTGEPGITLVNTLPLERYVESVIGSEMNPAAPEEFLKAHAVISRGWAFGKTRHGKGSAGDTGKTDTMQEMVIWQDTGDHTCIDVCSDDHCQRYQGRDLTPHPSTANAVRATRGLVLSDNDGNIADTRFSKCCGGMTELFSTCWGQHDPSYLISREDPWCDLSGMDLDRRRVFLESVFKDYDADTDFFRWETVTDAGSIRTRLKTRFGRDIGGILDMRAIRRGPSGRISLLELTGTTGTLRIGKELAVRRLLSDTHLFSSAFTIRREGKSFRLSGKGWGHGVGLCQAGAAHMALAGHTFDEILAFYYPGTILTKLYD